MSAAVKPRLTAALEVTFSTAQCHWEPAFIHGYTVDRLCQSHSNQPCGGGGPGLQLKASLT